MTRRPLVAALVLVFLTLPAVAQAPLDDGAPAGTMAYFGWSGTAAVEADYAKSTLKKLIDLTEPQDVGAAWDRARRSLVRTVDQPDFTEGLEVVLSLWDAGFTGPFAAWFAVIDENALLAGEPDDALAAALCWGTADPAAATALTARLQGLIDEMPPDLPVTLERRGETVRLLIATPAAQQMLAASPPMGIVDHAGFNASLNAVGPAPLVAWADLRSATVMLRQALTDNLNVMTDADQGARILAGLDVLNLEGIHGLAVAAGFDGADFSTRLRIDAPAPRRGLAALIDAPPLTADDLAAVPADAAVALAWSFDAGALLDLVREVTQAASPDGGAQFEDVLARAGGMVGGDLEADFFDALGTAHVFFQDPDIAGPTAMSTVWTNRLREPEAFTRTLTNAQNVLAGLVAMVTSEQPFTVTVRAVERDGLTLNTVQLPGIAPTWAVVGDRLHVGLFPQSLLAAADRLKADAPVLMDHPGFGPVVEAIAERPITAFSFVDVPAAAGRGYGTLLVAEHLLSGASAMALREPMPAVLPPFGRVAPLLAPVWGTGEADDAGYRSESFTPFPGAGLLSGGGAGSGQLLMYGWAGVAAGVGSYQENQGGFSGPDPGFAPPPAGGPPPPAPPRAPL